MLLRSIRPGKGGRTRLIFEGGPIYNWPSVVVRDLDLEEGKTYQQDKLRERFRNAASSRLSRMSRQYLARYVKSTRQYRNHFIRKGYPEDLVESLIPALTEEGYLDDGTVAREHVRRRKERKPRGRRKLRAELKEKGIERELIQRVLDEMVPRDVERRLARSYCEDHEGLSRRKLAGRLERRGFPSGLIHDLLDEFAGEENTDN